MPAYGALFGAWVQSGPVWSRGGVSAVEAEIGRRFDIDHRFYAWRDVFPNADQYWDVANGRIPLVTWEPWTASLAEIASGADDALIRQRAEALRTFGGPIFLRFAHEMNGDWYPWDGYHNGKSDGAAAYVAAWRHVHDIFAAANASNVLWVWCPTATSVPDAGWNSWRRYYPGDAYVDWVCVDTYNRQATAWSDFARLVTPFYRDYARRKPIMIGEAGSVDDVSDQKARWIEDAAGELEHSFPDIAAFVWFDANTGSHDWRFDSSKASLAAYAAMASTRFFNTRAQALAAPRGLIWNLQVRASHPPASLPVSVTFRARSPLTATVTVRDGTGRVVRTIASRVHLAPGLASFAWNGTTSRGDRVGRGSFTLFVSVRAAGGRQDWALAPFLTG